jgi:hypothetical protein
MADVNPKNKNRRCAATRIMKSLRDITMGECIRNKSTRFGLSVVSTEKQKEPKMFVAEQSEVRDIVKHITAATLQYLKCEIQSNAIHMPYYYRDSIHIIQKMIHDNDNGETSLLNSVLQRQFDYQQQDVLTYFRINGFSTLCSKPELCGVYSRGNSLDIVELFHILEPILKQINTSTYQSIYGGVREYSMYLIFRICAETPNTRVQGLLI